MIGQTISAADLRKMLDSGEKKFRGMKLPGADFRGRDLKNGDFRGASLPGALLDDTDLTFANFDGANCYAASFNGALLHRTNLANANISEAAMDARDMFGVTVTMECQSFRGLRVSPGWWWGWIFYALLMSPTATPDFDPQKAKDDLKVLMGAERWEVLRRAYSNRGM